MIKFLEVRNFQCLDGEYEFKDVNYLKGKNGAGKTAMARAILFAYTGRDEHGDQSTSRLMKNPEETMYVKIITIEGIEIERRQTKSSKTVKVNGVQYSNEDFERMMPVSPGVFASCFMSGHFSNLPEMEKRLIFMSVTKPVDKGELFAKMVGMHPTKIEIDWSIPTKKLYTSWNRSRLEKEKELKKNEGQLIAVGKMLAELKIGTLINFDGNIERLADIEKERAVASKLIAAKGLWQHKKEEFDKIEQENSSLDEINCQKIEKLKKLKIFIAEDKEKLTAARDKYQAMRAELKALPSKIELRIGECPLCESNITKTKVNAMNARNRKAIKTRAEIKSGLVAHEHIIENLKDRFKAYEIDELKLVTRERRTSVNPGKCPEGDCSSIENLIEEASVRNKKLREDSVWNENIMTQRKLKIKYEKIIAETTSIIDKLNVDYDFTQRVTNALHPDKGIDVEVIKEKMKDVKLKDVEFVLTDHLKNGVSYDCFKIKYKGILYPYLSEGQKIKVSAQIATLVDTLIGVKVGMLFVDNVELMDEKNIPDVIQVFIPVVDKTKESIEVEWGV